MEFHSPIARFLVVMAAFVVVVAGMKSAESLLVPFFLSLFIAIICSPPLMWMRSKGIPTGLALIIIISILVAASVSIGAIIGTAVRGFTADLPQYQVKLTAITAQLFDRLEGFGLELDIQQLRETIRPSRALAMAGTTLASFGNLMTNFLLILLTVVFILAEEVSFASKLAFNSKTKASINALEKFTKSVNQYVVIKTLMSLLTGFLILIWLWFLDLDYFVLWGLLAFLLNFIPTFGSVLAAVPAVLLALVQLSVGEAFLVAAGFLAVNFGVGNLLEPRVMGKGLDLSALVVFLSLVFWGWVLGPVGMLLSIPLTMMVKIALESFSDTHWIGVMLGSGKVAQTLSENLAMLAGPNDADDTPNSANESAEMKR